MEAKKNPLAQGAASNWYAVKRQIPQSRAASPEMSAHVLSAIQTARESKFNGFADALATLWRREFGRGDL